jgi:hypothetical protein
MKPSEIFTSWEEVPHTGWYGREWKKIFLSFLPCLRERRAATLETLSLPKYGHFVFSKVKFIVLSHLYVKL